MDAKHKLTGKELADLLNDPNWRSPLPPLLTPKDIATALGVSVNTVYAWSSQGRLDECKVQVGKYRRFLRDKFFQLLINEGLHAD
jgi:excisionase family DNA binding protein